MFKQLNRSALFFIILIASLYLGTRYYLLGNTYLRLINNIGA